MYIFFTSAPPGGEWSTSVPGHFTPSTYWIGVGWTPERENSWPYRVSNSDLSVFQPVASCCTDYAIPAHDITPYSPLKLNQRFGGKYHFHLQTERINQGLHATCFHTGFLFGIFFDPEDGMVCSSETLVNIGWLSMDHTVLYATSS
jgi:hypothetical protein